MPLESKIMNYLSVFHCIHVNQLQLLLPGYSNKLINRAVKRLTKNSGVVVDGPGGKYVILSKNEYVDYGTIDIIWFLLRHASDEEEFQTAIVPSPPLRLCYILHGILYYIYYASNSNAGLELQKIQEHLDALTMERNRIKVVVVSREEKYMQMIPRMTYPVLCAIPQYKNDDFESEPEFTTYEKEWN